MKKCCIFIHVFCSLYQQMREGTNQLIDITCGRKRKRVELRVEANTIRQYVHYPNKHNDIKKKRNLKKVFAENYGFFS